MDNQVDFINLAPKVGPEAIAAGAAQFATALAGASVKIGEKFAEQEKARQQAIAEAKKQKDKTRASIRKEVEKARRSAGGALQEKGQDTIDFDTNSKALAEKAIESELMLTPPYSDSYSPEELQQAQTQVDEFYSYINTSKAAGGKIKAAVEATNEITNSGGLPDHINGYTNNVIELLPNGINSAVDFEKNGEYNVILSSYFTERKVLPSGWNVTSKNESVKGQSITTYTFTGGNNEEFSYSIDGSGKPLEFATEIGDDALFDATKTIKDEKDSGKIFDRFKYSSTASREGLGDDLERINEQQFINMQGIKTEFKDQVRGNIQGAFLDGKVGLLNYVSYNVGKEELIDKVLEIYNNDESDVAKVNELTDLIFNPMFDKFESKYNPREATEEEIQQAQTNGVELIKNKDGVPMVYSEVNTGEAKTKPSDGSGPSLTEKQQFAAAESVNMLFKGKLPEVQVKGGLQLVKKDGKVFIKDYGSYQGLSVAKDTFKEGFSNFVELKLALPEVFGPLTPAERKQLQ